MIHTVCGIGLRAPDLSLSINYQPDFEGEYKYKIVANSGVIMDYRVYAKGNFKDYITFDQDYFEDVASGSVKVFTATLSLPEETIAYGSNRNEICAVEMQSQSEGAFQLKTESCAIISIYVPYPYLYALLNIEVDNVNVGEPVDFVITANNRGQRRIQDASVVLQIYNLLNESIATLNSESTSIESVSLHRFNIQFDTDGILAGEYRAVAKMQYDGEEVSAEKSFNIGTLKVDIDDYTSEFEVNKTSKFDIYVSSKWNDKIDQIHGEVHVGNSEPLITPSVELNPWESKTLSTYWDTSGIELGEHEAKIILLYNDKETEKDVILKVIKPEIIEEEIKEDEPEPEPEKKDLFTIQNLIIAAVLLVVLFDLFWMLLKKKRKSADK